MQQHSLRRHLRPPPPCSTPPGVQLLMVAGQQGLTTAEAVNKGVEMGFTTRDASTQHFKK